MWRVGASRAGRPQMKDSVSGQFLYTPIITLTMLDNKFPTIFSDTRKEVTLCISMVCHQKRKWCFYTLCLLIRNQSYCRYVNKGPIELQVQKSGTNHCEGHTWRLFSGVRQCNLQLRWSWFKHHMWKMLIHVDMSLLSLITWPIFITDLSIWWRLAISSLHRRMRSSNSGGGFW